MPEFPPAIPLRGGPYDGMTAAELSDRDHASHGVLFFSDRLIAQGPEGRFLYRIAHSDAGPTASFAGEASE